MEEIGPEEYWRTAADYRMKNIGAEWRNLAEGLLRIEALEAQVRAEWGLQLEMARRAAEEAGRQRNRRLRRAGLIAALVLALLLLTVSFVLRFAPANAAALGLLIAASAMRSSTGSGCTLIPWTLFLIPRISPTVGGTRSQGAPRRYGAPGPPCRRGATVTSARRHSSPTSLAVFLMSTWP